MLIVKAIGGLDILGGVLLVLSVSTTPLFAIFFILKGIWSIISSVGSGYYADWMGAVDLLTGIGLYLVLNGITNGIFKIVGIAMILKGLYTYASG